MPSRLLFHGAEPILAGRFPLGLRREVNLNDQLCTKKPAFVAGALVSDTGMPDVLSISERAGKSRI